MGVVHIIAGIMIFTVIMVILLQPITLLNDELADVLGDASTKTGRNMETGETGIEVGPSSAFPDMTLALIAGIGFFITLGFVIWIIRFGQGGMESTPESDYYEP